MTKKQKSPERKCGLQLPKKKRKVLGGKKMQKETWISQYGMCSLLFKEYYVIALLNLSKLLSDGNKISHFRFSK